MRIDDDVVIDDVERRAGGVFAELNETDRIRVEGFNPGQICNLRPVEPDLDLTFITIDEEAYLQLVPNPVHHLRLAAEARLGLVIAVGQIPLASDTKADKRFVVGSSKFE